MTIEILVSVDSLTCRTIRTRHQRLQLTVRCVATAHNSFSALLHRKTLKKQDKCLCIIMAQDVNQLWSLVNTIMKHSVPLGIFKYVVEKIDCYK